MTIESARDLYQRINEDADFRASLEAASEEEKKQLIKDAGYEVTCKEWKQAIAEIEAVDPNQELSEEELEAVAGGIAMGYGVTVGASNTLYRALLSQ